MLVSPESIKVYTFIRTVYTENILQTPGERINHHWHNYYQLLYVRRGSGAVIIDGSVFPLTENDVFILRRNELHAFSASAEALETYELKFIILDDAKDFLAEEPRYFCTDRDGAIRRALKQIEFESDTMLPHSSEIIALELCKVFLLMRRELTSRNESTLTTEKDVVHSDLLLQKVDSYIEQNIHRSFTVRDIANHLFMEYSYFSRLFSARYGIRLKQYINQKRLAFTKDMITSTNLTMTEIAIKCGFETLYQMERIFKKEDGISPTAFRHAFLHQHAVNFGEQPKTFNQFNDSEIGENNHDTEYPDPPCC